LGEFYGLNGYFVSQKGQISESTGILLSQFGQLSNPVSFLDMEVLGGGSRNISDSSGGRKGYGGGGYGGLLGFKKNIHTRIIMNTITTAPPTQ
jgi:hypothetical protein